MYNKLKQILYKSSFMSGLFITKNVNMIEELIIKKAKNFFKNIYLVNNSIFLKVSSNASNQDMISRCIFILEKAI
jgi:hypothetical protein